MLNKERDSFKNVVSRRADRLVESVDEGLILHHDLRRSLQLSQSKCLQVILFDPCELRDDPHDCHLCH